MTYQLPILRTSERKCFKRCQAKWWWSYREGLKPKGSESTPLWFGTIVHLALAEWYLPGTKRGPHPAETFVREAGEGLRTIKTSDATEERMAQYEDGVTLGKILLEEYVKKYGTDPQWEFIQAEQRFSLDVPWPKMAEGRQKLWTVDDGELLCEYDGTFDGVYRDLETGRLELLETKTAKAISISHLWGDDQAGSYYAVASHTLAKQGLIKPGERLAGINYNFLKKSLPDERPKDAEGYYCNKPKKDDYIAALEGYASQTAAQLKKLTLDMLEVEAQVHGLTVLGERSKVQPGPLFHREMVNRTGAERKTQLRRIQDEAMQMQLLREGLLPIVKNPTRDCTWDCDHFQMCQLQENGGNWEDFKEVAYKVVDPYADHRKSSDE